jgi:hypothetical protein
MSPRPPPRGAIRAELDGMEHTIERLPSSALLAATRRDPRLSELLVEDHQGFILARAISRAAVLSDALIARVYVWCDATLLPHFEVEEQLRVPALGAPGDSDGVALADRLLRDHSFIREDLLAARSGDVRRLRAFAALLAEHVRFERQELFPVCERLLPDSVLDRVAEEESLCRQSHSSLDGPTLAPSITP